MYKISLERVLEARQRLDKSSRGTDEEYYNNLFNEWKTMREYNFLSAQNLVPAKPPEKVTYFDGDKAKIVVRV